MKGNQNEAVAWEMDQSQSVYGKATQISPAIRGQQPETNLHEQTRIVELFVAGDPAHAKQIVRKFCAENPCCVTVTETTYIFAGGEERGIVVAFRNYPRFPTDSYSLREMSGRLGAALRDALAQHSFMVVDHSGMTTWSSTKNV